MTTRAGSGAGCGRCEEGGLQWNPEFWAWDFQEDVESGRSRFE